MGNEYKKIILLKGFQHISDKCFNMIKSLLKDDLKLTSKTQDEYDRTKIADLMEMKFRGPACVDKLIELFREIDETKDLVKTLRKEKLKAIKTIKAKGATPAEKQDKSSLGQSTSTANEASGSESVKDTPVKKEENACLSTGKIEDITTRTADPRMKLSLEQSQLLIIPTCSITPTKNCLQTPQKLPPTTSSSSSTKKPRLKSVPKEASREEGLQRGPKEVMVLKATEPFTYDVTGGKMMFHATVATESRFFQVKIFNVALKEKFIPNKVIAISDYIGRNGFLEVFSVFSVSDVNPDRKMEISKSLIQKAKATPKISHLYLQHLGTFVNGVFVVHKKWAYSEFIYYEIRDDTGVMDVVVYGQRLTSINCEEGDRLTLVCFELAESGAKRQLRSVIHSYIKFYANYKLFGVL
ncbi:interferon-activable protein 203-like [Budorcas taxicolor]|uniref:interferon-activable protein 203-like n=1 Tax=Budorcas taxicolor TaxID=37181 RepID=UPI0022833910|nr:interferon-activable protein 203-like [Budorcas taxicolor]